MFVSRHRRGKFRTRTGTVRSATELAQINEQVQAHEGPVQIVRSEGLSPLASRPALGNYLVQLWDRRFFIIADARARALRSTRDYRLWRLWLVLNPLFDVVLYGFLFGFLFRTSRGIDNFIGFLFIGIIFMRMITSFVSSGTGLLASNRAMIRAFPFPRASIPLSATIRSLIDNVLPAVVALTAAFILQWGTWPTWTILFVVPLYLMMHLFGCGLMFIMARLTAEIRDVKVLVPLFTQAWFFLSGVMFSVDRFAHIPVVHDLMSANPAYIFLTAVRDTTIYRTLPDLATWGTLLAWTLGTFIVGFVYFWRAEAKYVRII